MATLFSILAWRISWTEQPGWLLSMGSQSRKRLKRLSIHVVPTTEMTQQQQQQQHHTKSRLNSHRFQLWQYKDKQAYFSSFKELRVQIKTETNPASWKYHLILPGLFEQPCWVKLNAESSGLRAPWSFLLHALQTLTLHPLQVLKESYGIFLSLNIK